MRLNRRITNLFRYRRSAAREFQTPQVRTARRREVRRQRNVQPPTTVTVESELAKNLNVVAVATLELPVRTRILASQRNLDAFAKVVMLEKVDDGSRRTTGAASTSAASTEADIGIRIRHV